MKLTRKEALKKCIDVWEYLARTGCSKRNACQELKFKYLKSYLFYCPLCEYSHNGQSQWQFSITKRSCSICPIVSTFNKTCIKIKCFSAWESTDMLKLTKRRAYYARLFLKKLKELK